MSDPTVAELKADLAEIGKALRRKYGERAGVILLLGIPVAGGHDRFAASLCGPCLTTRGLLSWGRRYVEEQITAGEKISDYEEL